MLVNRGDTPWPSIRKWYQSKYDGAEAEVGAYIQLYDAAAQSFSESTNLPPQGAGYIQLICCVPTGWQKLSVTFTPTFVANKSLTFSLNSSDLTQA